MASDYRRDRGGRPVTQLILVLSGEADTVAVRLVRFVSFFTVDSNIIVLVVTATLAARPDRDGQVWRVARLDSLVCITVTGIVYVTLLRPIVHLTGLPKITDIGLHYVVPLMTVIGWALFGPRPRIGLRTVGLALVFPVAWFGYTLIRGALTDEYPYPFIDVAGHGYAVVLLNCLGVTVLFLAVGAAYLLIDRLARTRARLA